MSREPDRTDVEILRSDSAGLRARLHIGQPKLQELLAAGEQWTRVTIAGLAEGSGNAGEPAVPVVRRLVAIPRGAVPELAFAHPAIGQRLYLNLYPFQPLRDEISIEVDRFSDQAPPPALFARQPFLKDASAYAGDTRFPRSIGRITPIGTTRDLQIAVLECACGQYNPATRVLQLFEEMEVDIRFRGGDGTFLDDAAMNPFESGTAAYRRQVLNRGALSDHVSYEPRRRRRCAGEELLILTHPNYRAAADVLAEWRSDRGIPTNVFNVNDTTGSGPDTNEQIRAFIHERYNLCAVRPSYVLLLGDVPEVPTWVQQRLGYPPGTTIATDFPYATLGSDPEAHSLLPDFAVGRIPVTSADEANAVVDKIMNYEAQPPSYSTAYHTVTVASFFQCCRTDVAMPGVEDGRALILNAEFLRDALTGIGYDVQRIYDTNTAYSEDPPYTADPTPRYFADSTPLPPDLDPDSGYAWSGNTPDIVSAINDGRSFVFHIDHGYSGGWCDPPFDKADLASLTNTFPPVAFDMDCDSGDFEATCFAEVALRQAGTGAIGVFGWTRMSNTGYYRSLLEGTLNALWPSSFPDFGDSTPKRRLGDLLSHSKIYMTQQMAGADPQSNTYLNAVNHVRLYHLIGDPTLEPWTLHPFKLPSEVEVTPLPNVIEILYGEEGATITTIQRLPDGSPRPIGRATVRNGRARLTPVLPPHKGPLYIAASKPNAIATVLPALALNPG